MRRRLRDLARATNDGRDVEVQLAWLGKQTQLLGPDDIPGFYWLVGRLEDRKQKTHDRAVADVARRYEKTALRLRRALGILRIELQTAQGQRPATFREATGALAQRQVQGLRDDLGRIAGRGRRRAGAQDSDFAQTAQVSAGADCRGNRRAGALIRRFKEAQDLWASTTTCTSSRWRSPPSAKAFWPASSRVWSPGSPPWRAWRMRRGGRRSIAFSRSGAASWDLAYLPVLMSLGAHCGEEVTSHESRVESHETRVMSHETRDPGSSPVPHIESGLVSGGPEPVRRRTGDS